MPDAGSSAFSVLDLGEVALDVLGGEEPIRVDVPLHADAEEFFSGALDRLGEGGEFPRLLLVAGPGGGREAGIPAVALARSAARRGMEALLVDACFASPSLAKPFPDQPDEGLSDMVLWGSSLHATLRKTQDEGIQLVNVGSPPPDPSGFFDEQETDTVLNTLREQAAVVLIIAPLWSERGLLSPLLGKADQTVIIRREGEMREDLSPTVPAGRIAEITVGSVPAKPVAPKPPPRPPVPEPAVSAASAPPPAASTVPTPPEPRRAGVPKGRGLPLGRFAILVGSLSVVIGLLVSFAFLRYRLDLFGGGTPVAVVTPEPGREAVAGGELEAGAAGEEAGATEDRSGESEIESAKESEPSHEARVGEDEMARAATAGEAGVEENERPGTGSAPAGAAEEPRTAQGPPTTESRPADRGAPAPPAGQASPGRLYGVHVESFSTGVEAERAASRYVDEGIAVTVVAKQIPDKGLWHRVVLGRFATKEEADRFSDEVKETFDLQYTLVVRIAP